MSHFRPPFKVTPLIKTMRYACLTAGIIYGFTKKRTFQMIEKKKEEQRDREKEARDKALEEDRIAQAGRKEFEKLLDSMFKPKSVPPGIQPQEASNKKEGQRKLQGEAGPGDSLPPKNTRGEEGKGKGPMDYSLDSLLDLGVDIEPEPPKPRKD